MVLTLKGQYPTMSSASGFIANSDRPFTLALTPGRLAEPAFEDPP
jgi:hypothetical protein